MTRDKLKKDLITFSLVGGVMIIGIIIVELFKI